MLILGIVSFLLACILFYPIRISQSTKISIKKDKPTSLDELLRLKAHAQIREVDSFENQHIAWQKEIRMIGELQKSTGIGVLPLIDHLINYEKDLQNLKREYENRSATARGASLTLIFMPLLMWLIAISLGVDVAGFLLSPFGIASLLVGLILTALSRFILRKLSQIAISKPKLRLQRTFSAELSALIGFSAIFSFQTTYFGFVMAAMVSILIHYYWHNISKTNNELVRFVRHENQHFQIVVLACLVDSGLSWSQALSKIEDNELNRISKRIELGFSAQAAFLHSIDWMDIGGLISDSIQKGTKLSEDLKSIAAEYRMRAFSFRINHCEKIAGKLVIPVNLLQIPAFILTGLVPLVAPLFLQTLSSFHI